jgi:DNA repair protein RAD50
MKKSQVTKLYNISIISFQKITFQSPLTLIVGANGCGKTTVIECLKYALTGEVPPGSGRGQSFVHDPKIYQSVECLGQVKLMVRDVKGNKITVTRSMKTVQKKLQVKFETMDSTIHVEVNIQQDSII